MSGRNTSFQLISNLLEEYIKEIRSYSDEIVSIQNDINDPTNDRFDVMRSERRLARVFESFSTMRQPYEKLAAKVSQLIDNSIIEDPLESVHIEVKLTELEALIFGVSRLFGKNK